LEYYSELTMTGITVSDMVLSQSLIVLQYSNLNMDVCTFINIKTERGDIPIIDA